MGLLALLRRKNGFARATLFCYIYDLRIEYKVDLPPYASGERCFIFRHCKNIDVI